MENLSNFSERLKELMEEHDLRAPALARIVHTDRTNITRYLRGERYPLLPTFLAMADYFACSADYLLGLTELAEPQQFMPAPPFAGRLRAVMQETKTTQYELEKELSLSGSVVYRWLHGGSLPTLPSLIRLAKHMECSVDYLLGRVR